jgi:hypothetical protein
MSWFTSDSIPALAWKEVGTRLNSHRIPLMVLRRQLNGNSIRVVVTSALMTNAAVYHVRTLTYLLRAPF